MRSLTLFIFILMTILPYGCGNESADNENEVDTTSNEMCSRSNIGCFDTSWQLSSETYELSLIMAAPTIPERGENSWTITVQDLNTAQSATGCTIFATPFMPEHNHGVSIPPLVVESGDGAYVISRIMFSMPGLWEMRFDITCSNSGISDQLVYSFWLEA